MARSPITPAHLASPTRLGFERCAARLLDHICHKRDAVRVLDLGCATGEYRFWFSGAVYTGLDVVARDLPPKLDGHTRFVLGDGSTLPFANDSFDVVLCAYVLDRVADANAALAECARVLAPGGHLLLAVPAPSATVQDAPLRVLQRLGLAVPNELSGQVNAHTFAADALSQTAAAAGFTQLALHTVGGPLTLGYKLCWLWARLAAHLATQAGVRWWERTQGQLTGRMRRAWTVPVLPRRPFKHARDKREFAALREACTPGPFGLLHALASRLLLAADGCLWPSRGTEHVALYQYTQTLDSAPGS